MRRFAVILAVVAFGAFAPAAHGAVLVSASPSAGVTIQGTPTADALRVFVESGTGIKVFEQATQPVTAGPGCTQQAANAVTCGLPSTRIVTASLGAGNDRLTMAPSTADCICAGQDGNDVLTTADGQDLLDGGAGLDNVSGGTADDVLRGGADADSIADGAGRDRVEGDGGSTPTPSGRDTMNAEQSPDGGDSYDGGPDFDTLSYSRRGTPVSVQPGNGANDGSTLSFENDDVMDTVENFIGGSGGDTLAGSVRSNRIEGGAGNDKLTGVANTLEAGGGSPDTLDGGLGSDEFSGAHRSDSYLARDAVDDQVSRAFSCTRGGLGTNNPTVIVDLRDDDTRPYPANCNIVEGAVDEHPNVRFRSRRVVRRRGRTRVRLSCPRKTRNHCRGRLSAARPNTDSFGRAKRYSIRRGRSKTIKGVRVPRRGRAIRFRSIERGRSGRRMTIKTLPVR